MNDESPNVNWDLPERFFLLLAEIPRLEQRLNCWWFARNFAVGLCNLR